MESDILAKFNKNTMVCMFNYDIHHFTTSDRMN